jgi:chondroitin AC lyase
MKGIRISLLVFMITLLQSQITIAQNDFDVVRKNIVNYLKEQTNFSNQDIQHLKQTQQTDGSWKDIPYGDSARTLWSPILHLQRIKSYCIAINQQSDVKLDKEIVSGLQYWLKKSPKSKNWWYNDIATPQVIGEILMLVDEAQLAYPKGCKDSLVESMKRGDPFKQTGANKLDIAMHYLYRACATKDETLMDASVNQLFAPISFSTEEGLQHDYSYFQHGKQLYLAGYGAVFLTGEYKAATAVMNTKYALSEEKLKLLNTFLTDTFLRAIRGRYSDFSIEGRSISRPDMLDKKIAVLDGYAENTTAMLTFAKNLNPYNSAAIESAMQRIQEEQPASFKISSYNKHFFRADYTLHQRKEYSFTIRAVSLRTKRTETGNGENLYGQFLADGSTNIQRTGSEYYNIMPLWEWDKIPGITARDYTVDQPATIEWGESGSNDFTGGVSDGKYGCTVYDMNYNQVTAKKAWFLFDKEIVCLGTGINCKEEENITTTINQCWLSGQVNLDDNKSFLTANEKLENPSWVWHDGIGYSFLQDTKAVLSAEKQNGSWKAINNGYSDAKIEGNVFKLFIDHGSKPNNATYAYCVLPNISLQKMNSRASRNITVLANNNEIQAVENKALQMLQVCFYQPQVFIHKKIKITIDKPCLMLIKNCESNIPEIWLSDPSQKQTEITITIQTKHKTVTKKIMLAVNENRGKSVKIDL